LSTPKSAGLNYLYAAGTATERDRRARVKLKTGRSTLTKGDTLGGRAVGSIEFAELRVKSERVPLDGDVPLATVDGPELKTLLASGSSTSVGAF
jgi:hypothetical protein